jgi:hypothetical protein
LRPASTSRASGPTWEAPALSSSWSCPSWPSSSSPRSAGSWETG